MRKSDIAVVYIFVDEHFPKDARNSAQGLFNVMILGVGALVAAALGFRVTYAALACVLVVVAALAARAGAAERADPAVQPA